MSAEAAAEWPELEIPFPSAVPELSEPPPKAIPLLELERPTDADASTLLGNRFLCRGGGLLVVGSSGIGKSTWIIQAGTCWAVGKPCFGIAPQRALKILYIQAENDQGDLCEMRDGVLENLELREDERQLLARNFICAFECSRAAERFGREVLEPLLQEHSPDLVILDPALSYIGGDANKQEVVGGFLRTVLNPLLIAYRCGVIVVHHTPKPSTRDNGNKIATDFAYAGTGSAEWANWARAVLVLSPKDDSGLRELRIGKRFRLGWKDATGKSCPSRLLRQSAEGNAIFYQELSAEEMIVMRGDLPPYVKVLRSGLLPEPGENVEKGVLVARVTGNKVCGRDKMQNEVIPLLIDEGYLELIEVPRSGARAAIHLKRTRKMPGGVGPVSE